MTPLLFATNNSHKIEEIRAAIGHLVQVIGLKEAGIHIDIPEPHHTLKENALAKVDTIYALTGTSCFSEDTGLEVDALGGKPGVYSARYAGEGRSAEDNIDKLLHTLSNIASRSARFRTVIALIWKGQPFFFEGVCEGTITTARQGRSGFGYDAVFQPSGSDMTFGEMGLEEKNRFSHRKKAAERLVLFLQQQS